jgi:hypothetical protein
MPCAPVSGFLGLVRRCYKKGQSVPPRSVTTSFCHVTPMHAKESQVRQNAQLHPTSALHVPRSLPIINSLPPRTFPSPPHGHTTTLQLLSIRFRPQTYDLAFSNPRPGIPSYRQQSLGSAPAIAHPLRLSFQRPHRLLPIIPNLHISPPRSTKGSRSLRLA